MKFQNLNRFFSIVLLVLAAGAASAQTTTVKVTPDCLFTGSITTSGNSSVAANGNGDNRSIGCNFWVVVWECLSCTLPTITVQSAPTAGGLPGSWVTYSGTVVAGTNPSVSSVGTTVIKGFAPWIRVNMTSSGGTLSARMFGYRDQGSAAGTVVSGTVAVSNFPASQAVTGVVSVSNFPASQAVTVSNFPANQVVSYATSCTNKAIISVTASGITQIVAASGSLSIKICHISMSSDAATNLKLVQGTGANCGTGTADVTGLYYAFATIALDRDINTINTSASQALCISSSAAVNVGGVILYAQN